MREPAEALAGELEPEFGGLKIFRPHRDVRFSADKRPYKEHLGLVSSRMNEPALYFQLSAEGVMVGGGLYQPDRDRLARFRALLDDPASAEDVLHAVEETKRAGFELLVEGALATAPRGFSVEHPHIELLRLKHLAIGKRLDRRDVPTDSTLIEIVSEAWSVVERWNQWLSTSVTAE